MKLKTIYSWLLIIFCAVVLISACTKYLDEKPNKKMVIVSSLTDLQSILEDYNWVNISTAPGEDASDNYYLTDADFAALKEYDRNMYTWNKENVFLEDYHNAWGICYNNVYRANTVLFNVDKVTADGNDNAADVANVRGQALFLRGISFLFAASVWAQAYDPGTADNDLGIPLRLTPDFNIPSERSSVKQTYNHIISDLREAITLLPIEAVAKTRAAKPVACAALARTFLYTRQYDSCYKYAALCLSMKNELLDFNTLGQTAEFPFEAIPFEDNPELLYYQMVFPSVITQARAKVDTLLYQSYSQNDLRKAIYFKDDGTGKQVFRGSRLGTILSIALSVNEVYLMHAECAARMGKKTEAMGDLNALLAKRWKPNLYIPIESLSDVQLLDTVLSERRKELVFTDTRWMDIKRLNKEGAGIQLKRIIDGKVYVLPANDLRYAFPIPQSVINSTQMPQNPR